MAKGYWVGHVTVTDPERYKDYIAANAAAFAKYGGRFLVRGGQFTPVVGAWRQRHVVIEFDSYQQALACWNSPEYAEASRIRNQASIGDIIVIEGV